MDKSKDYKQIALEIVSRVGKLKAHELLVSEKVSPSATTKLLKGKYPSEIGELLGAAILRAEQASMKLVS